MGPVTAPTGTMALIMLALTRFQAAATPPKVSGPGSSRCSPMMITSVPTGPQVGVKLEIMTADGLTGASGKGWATRLAATANGRPASPCFITAPKQALNGIE
jgi:hypothetical protein